jgi:hypothetical protein
MLLTTKYDDGLPLQRFEKVLSRHGVDTLGAGLSNTSSPCLI